MRVNQEPRAGAPELAIHRFSRGQRSRERITATGLPTDGQPATPKVCGAAEAGEGLTAPAGDKI